MKRKLLLIIISVIAFIAVALILIFTRHTHVFSEATCTTAHICECGEINGEPLEHTYIEATCTESKTCELCGTTEGEPINHSWLDATHNTPKTCELCGLTEGESIIYPLNWDSINPKVHAPFNQELEIPELDSTIKIYLHQNCPAFADMTIEDVDFTATQYLKEYYSGSFGDTEWAQFVATGDVSVLNLKNQSNNDSANLTEEDFERICELLGIDPSEIESMEAAGGSGNNTGGNTGGNGSTSNSGGTNGGGGSAPVVHPGVNQNTSEDNFVTPEIPSGGNTDPWQGDGTFELGDLGDGGEIVGPDINWN